MSEHTRPPIAAPDPAWDIPMRGFVPVGDVATREPVARPVELPLAAVDAADWDAQVSLFGDLDP